MTSYITAKLRPAKAKPQSEADLQRAVFAWMKSHGIFAWRMPVGPVVQRQVVRGAMQTHWKKSPLKGFPDIAGVLRRGRPGVLFVLELKSKRGECTPEQVSWMVDLQAAGAAGAVVRSLDDLYRVMREWGEVA
jgi:hypothetical protein